MKTIYIQIVSMVVLMVAGTTSCSNGEEFFEDERYVKMVYAISDEDNIFNAEYILGQEEELIATQPFAVSGTNPIEQDVHLTVENDPDMITEYNFANYLDEEEKYAHSLEDYSLPSYSVEIKSGVAPSYEVGKLQVKIRRTILEKLSTDSVYFIAFRIKEASPYTINEKKRNVLFRIYKKNDYASQKTTTYYASSGFINDVSTGGSTSKIVTPLSYNQVRTYVAGEVYSTNDSKSDISKKAIVLTVDADNKVTVTAYDQETLTVETLTPSDNPEDDSYGYRNYYSPLEKQFYLYYRFDNGRGWKEVRETLRSESIDGE